ncbi:MAG: hypothetical protein MI685_01745 [Chlorobiales bacterium]|nr:hypothetical protein [Chlorobiales bacterium]
MKNLVFAILIVFIPAVFTGCKKGDNIVEKLTPEPMLESKYGLEKYAHPSKKGHLDEGVFENQTTFTKKEIREYAQYVKNAREISDISRGKKRNFEDNMDDDELRRFENIGIPYLKKLFDNARYALTRHLDDIDKAFSVFTDMYEMPPRNNDPTREWVLKKRVFIAVIFGYAFEDIQHAFMKEHMFMAEDTKDIYQALRK